MAPRGLRWVCDAKSQNLFAAANLQFELHMEIFILVIYQEFHRL